MSLDDNKRRMLEARGKFHMEPNDHGGCARHIVQRESARYRLVLDTRYTPCDSLSTWTERSAGVETTRSHQWSAAGPTASPWFGARPNYEIRDDRWQLLGPPSVTAMVRNFLSAMLPYVAKGFKHVPVEVMEARLTRCRACDYWNEHARYGFGKCKHPGCGCTKAKLWMHTESCPQGFWQSITETHPS